MRACRPRQNENRGELSELWIEIHVCVYVRVIYGYDGKVFMCSPHKMKKQYVTLLIRAIYFQLGHASCAVCSCADPRDRVTGQINVTQGLSPPSLPHEEVSSLRTHSASSRLELNHRGDSNGHFTERIKLYLYSFFTLFVLILLYFICKKYSCSFGLKWKWTLCLIIYGKHPSWTNYKLATEVKSLS